MKRVFLLIIATSLLSGCLSHWIIENEVRLQIENKTPHTILSLNVVSLDSSMQKQWIKETLLPGERSSVVSSDWVGSFNLSVFYLKYGELDTLSHVFESVSLEGGSIFAQISEKSGFWTFKQK